MLDSDLIPIKNAVRPHGPFGRATLYRLDADYPGLLRRLPGMRDTFVHKPTLKRIEATAQPMQPAALAAQAA